MKIHNFMVYKDNNFDLEDINDSQSSCSSCKPMSDEELMDLAWAIFYTEEEEIYSKSDR